MISSTTDGKLPRATFRLTLADGAFAAHLLAGDGWESTAYAAESSHSNEDDSDEAPVEALTSSPSTDGAALPIEELFELHERAIAAMPKSERPYRASEQLAERAVLEARLGRPDRARSALARARKEGGEYDFGLARSAGAIALAAALKGDRTEARAFIEIAEGALHGKKSPDEAHLQLAAAWTVLGDAERAAKHTKASESLEEDSIYDRVVGGQALALCGRLAEAAKLAYSEEDAARSSRCCSRSAAATLRRASPKSTTESPDTFLLERASPWPISTS